MSQELSIVIPCYNEEKNIPLIFDRLNQTIGDRTNIEVVLVDNGSTDNSPQVFNEQIQHYKKDYFKVVRVEKNQGYGHGILYGLEHCSCPTLAWTHADMQTDPNDVLLAYDKYNQYSPKPFIKGKRRQRKLLEAFFTWGMQIVAWWALKVKLDDINAQPKMFSKDFYESYIKDKAPLDFSLDLFVLYQAKKNNIKTLEVPVYFKKRMHGEAKGGGNWKTRIKLIRRTFAYIFELKNKL